MTAHRDTIVSGLLGMAPRTPGKVTPVWVAGAGLVFRHTERSPVPGRSNFGSYTQNDVAFGVGGGLDMFIHLSPRLSLLPTFRFHYVFDEDRRLDGVVNRGVGSMIWRGGVGVGVRL